MHENNKHMGRKKKRASIDGIISDGRRLGLPLEQISAPKTEKTEGLDGVFAQEEGFHPMRASNQDLGADPNAYEEVGEQEPIVLPEHNDKPHRRRFISRIFKKPSFKKPTRRQAVKRSLIALGVLILVVGGYFGIKFYQTERSVFRGGGKAPALSSKVDISQLKGEGDGRINILMLGVGGPGHDGPDLTDTIMLVSIDPVNSKVDLLSIPRDLWVKIPSNGYQKINAAYAYGKQQSKGKTEAAKDQDGLDLLDQTIAPVIGVTIHYHAVVDFQAFKDMVDAVGGITFNVPELLYDPTIAWENDWNATIAKQGVQTMKGKQALLYVRSRETSSDFARGERQRQVMIALKDKILSVGTFGNPIKISNLLNSFGNNVYTDFSLSDMNRLYQIFSKIPSANIQSLDLVTPPHKLLTTAPVNGLSTVQPVAGTFDYTAIQNYIRTTLKDGYIAQENASIAVYNATATAGLATTKANLLKSYGYNVTTIDTAKNTTNPARTVVVDLSGGKNKYTKNYLQKRFAVNTITTIPADTGIVAPLNTDFVIILGQDATTASQN